MIGIESFGCWVDTPKVSKQIMRNNSIEPIRTRPFWTYLNLKRNFTSRDVTFAEPSITTFHKGRKPAAMTASDEESTPGSMYNREPCGSGNRCAQTGVFDPDIQAVYPTLSTGLPRAFDQAQTKTARYPVMSKKKNT
jgi:hypothetical protein